MPTMIRLLTPEGLRQVDYTADSLNDAARYEPDDGIYTVANTLNTYQTLRLNDHLDRMEDSARRADVPLVLDRARLKAALRQMISESGYGDVRFRITVSRNQPDVFILTIEPYHPPSAQLIKDGVKVITAPHSARKNPAAKTTDWMHLRQRLVEAQPAGVYDTLLLDDSGHILEGLGANFYAIKEDTLHTAGEGVLPGISQKIVFDVAPSILPVVREAVTVNEIPDLQEAFITSSSRGVIPVVEIDGHTLGDGTPGPWTMRIRAAYVDWMNVHLEDL